MGLAGALTDIGPSHFVMMYAGYGDLRSHRSDIS